jgi:putative ABC transport system permease protein
MESLIISNLKQRPLRSLVSIAGVALGVVLVMLFSGLARGMTSDVERRASNMRAEIIFTRAGASGTLASTATNVSTKYVDLLKQIDGVADAVPVVKYFFEGGKGIGFEQIEGVDWNQYASLNGMRLDAGRPPQGDAEVVVDEVKARDNGLSVGSKIKIFGNREFTVAGIYSPESGARVKMPIGGMQSLLEAGDKCSLILVKAGNVDAKTLARRIDEKLPGNQVQLTHDIVNTIEKNIPFLGVFLRVLVVLAGTVSALVVMLAMYTTITERTREIGILKAMGASRAFIVGVIEKEAVAISILGLLVGFVIAIVAGACIHRVYGLFFEFGLDWAAVAALIGLFGGAVGALYPALRASNLDPVSAISYD